MIDLPSHFEGVRQTGPDRYLARCSAHDDVSPSLSLRLVGDRWLIHCFAGCEALDVVHAVGLELADLFADSWPRGEPSRRRETRRRIPVRDILEAVDFEVLVASVIAANFVKRKSITTDDWDRLAVAAHRIGAARDLAR